MLGNVADTANEVIYNGANPTALYLLFLVWLMSKGLLAHHTKQIIGNDGQFQNQFVCLKFTGRQALYVPVSLDFTVVLLADTVGMIRGDDIIVCPVEIRPPGIQLNIGKEKDLPLFVNGAFNDFVDDTHTNGLFHTVVVNILDIFP